MRSKTNILNPDLHDYLLTILPEESKHMKKLREKTNAHPYHPMQTTPEQATLLSWLVTILAPKCIVEIGVFTGHSTLAMAEALTDDAKIYACDKNQEWTDYGYEIWQHSPHAHKIDLTISDGQDYLNKLMQSELLEKVDMIFIDADKPNYQSYYELSLKLLKPGGVLILDNIFLMGRVVTDGNEKHTARNIRELNSKIQKDPRIKPCVIPIGDGMTAIYKL